MYRRAKEPCHLTRRRSRQAAECRARRPSRLVRRETDGVTPLAAAQRQLRVHRGKRRAACPLARVCGLQLSVCAVRRTSIPAAARFPRPPRSARHRCELLAGVMAHVTSRPGLRVISCLVSNRVVS